MCARVCAHVCTRKSIITKFYAKNIHMSGGGIFRSGINPNIPECENRNILEYFGITGIFGPVEFRNIPEYYKIFRNIPEYSGIF